MTDTVRTAHGTWGYLLDLLAAGDFGIAALRRLDRHQQDHQCRFGSGCPVQAIAEATGDQNAWVIRP
jgi:hypothetical protein